MVRKIIFAAGLLLAPQLASAQTVVTDPQLIAVARQQLVVLQQQLAVLNTIAALEQVKVSGPVATAALTYAQRQGLLQAQAEAAAAQQTPATAAQ